MKKVSSNTSFVVRYKSHKPIQFQNSYKETTYVITRNIKLTTTRLVYILIRFHAVSSRILLKSWHSKNSEPKIHLFLLDCTPHSILVATVSNNVVQRLPGAHASRGMNAKNRTRGSSLWILIKRERERLITRQATTRGQG